MDSIQHAAQEQFQKQSHRYARGHILENTLDVSAALEGIGLPPGAEALDVATGAGHTAFCLARAGFRVTASDLTPAMLERVREGAAERGLEISTRQHSAEALPYPDGAFDLVSCRVAPHHFSSPGDFVRESARVLKPGGWFLVIDGTVPDDAPDAERGLEISTRQHSAEALPYADGIFDLVSCRVAPHHFSSPGDFVRESARVLKPGGWFLVIDGTVPDDAPDAEEWLHKVEKYRDPSHNRLLPPREWRSLCERHGLVVEKLEVAFRKQPDLEWYFETAATTPESREKVRGLVATASEPIRRHYRLAEEEGKTVWWWPMLTLLARKPG